MTNIIVKQVALIKKDYYIKNLPPTNTYIWNTYDWIEYINENGIFYNLDYHRRCVNQCSI